MIFSLDYILMWSRENTFLSLLRLKGIGGGAIMFYFGQGKEQINACTSYRPSDRVRLKIRNNYCAIFSG